MGTFLGTKARSQVQPEFPENQLSFAFDAYLASEKRLALDHDAQVVLVAVDSLAALRAAYPNYYLDAAEFVSAMRRALGS